MPVESVDGPVEAVWESIFKVTLFDGQDPIFELGHVLSWVSSPVGTHLKALKLYDSSISIERLFDIL